MTAEQEPDQPEPLNGGTSVEPEEPEPEEAPKTLSFWPDVAKPARENPPEIPGG